MISYILVSQDIIKYSNVLSIFQICLTKLDDIQLAIVVAKLYSSDLMESGLASAVRELLVKHVCMPVFYLSLESRFY